MGYATSERGADRLTWINHDLAVSGVGVVSARLLGAKFLGNERARFRSVLLPSSVERPRRAMVCAAAGYSWLGLLLRPSCIGGWFSVSSRLIHGTDRVGDEAASSQAEGGGRPSELRPSN